MGKPHLSSKQRRQKVKKTDGETDAKQPPASTTNDTWTSATTAKENSDWEEYYRRQKVVPDTEWDAFMTSLRADLPIAFRVLTCTPHQYYIREEIARTQALLKAAGAGSCSATSPAAPATVPADSSSLSLATVARCDSSPATEADTDSIPPKKAANNYGSSKTAAPAAYSHSSAAVAAAADVDSSSTATEGLSAAPVSRHTFFAAAAHRGGVAQVEGKEGTDERKFGSSEAAAFKIGDARRTGAAAREAPSQEKEEEKKPATEQRIVKKTEERMPQPVVRLTGLQTTAQPAAAAGAAAAIPSPFDAFPEGVAAKKGSDAADGACAGEAERKDVASTFLAAAGADTDDVASGSTQVAASVSAVSSREFEAAPAGDAAPAAAAVPADATAVGEAGARNEETKNLANCIKALSWYLQGSEAYQIEVSRSTLRSCRLLSGFHRFLVSQSEAGTIIRQEVVSMVPVLFFDIKADSYVLDMCAAPGSKTSQLLERMHVAHQQQQAKRNLAADAASHSEPRPGVPRLPSRSISTANSIDDMIPPGMVVANDADAGRAHMLIHRLKHLHSPCLLVVSHSAEYFPTLFLPPRSDNSALYNGLVGQTAAAAQGDGEKAAGETMRVEQKLAGTGTCATLEAHTAAAALTRNVEPGTVGEFSVVEAAVLPSEETPFGATVTAAAAASDGVARPEAGERTAAQRGAEAVDLDTGKAVCGDHSLAATLAANAQPNAGGRCNHFAGVIPSQQPSVGCSRDHEMSKNDDYHGNDARRRSVPTFRPSPTENRGSSNRSSNPSSIADPSCCLLENKEIAGTNGSRRSSAVLEPLQYDCVLCDVPCTADGTLRKSRMLWTRWHPNQALACHRLQLRILLRGIRLCRVGGRVVYSTCSFNPVENEAVVAAALVKMKGAVQLVDCSPHFPSLKRRPGLSTWQVKAQGRWYSNFEDVPESLRRRLKLRETAFPPCQGGLHSEGARTVYDNVSARFTRSHVGNIATCNGRSSGTASDSSKSSIEESCGSSGLFDKSSTNSNLPSKESCTTRNSSTRDGKWREGRLESRCCQDSSTYVCRTLSCRVGTSACTGKDSRGDNSSDSVCVADGIRDGLKHAIRESVQAPCSSKSCTGNFRTWGDSVKGEAKQRDVCGRVCDCSSRSAENYSRSRDGCSRDRDDGSGDNGDGRGYIPDTEAFTVELSKGVGKPSCAPSGDTRADAGVASATGPMPLHHCMRFLPHLNNTGGFFVAVFHKIHQGPRSVQRMEDTGTDFSKNNLSEQTDAQEGLQRGCTHNKREAGVTDDESGEEATHHKCHCPQAIPVTRDGAEGANAGGSRHPPRVYRDVTGHWRQSLAAGDLRHSAGGNSFAYSNNSPPGMYKETQPHQVRSSAAERTASGDWQPPVQVQLDFLGLGWKDSHIELQHLQHLHRLTNSPAQQKEERSDSKKQQAVSLLQRGSTVQQPELETSAKQQQTREKKTTPNRTAEEARKEVPTNRWRHRASVAEHREDEAKYPLCLVEQQEPHVVGGHLSSKSVENCTGSPLATPPQPFTTAPSVQACCRRRENLEAAWRAACDSLGLRSAIRLFETLNESACTHAEVAPEELAVARRLLGAFRGILYVRNVDNKCSPQRSCCGLTANSSTVRTAGQTATTTGTSPRCQRSIQDSASGASRKADDHFPGEDDGGLRDVCSSDQFGVNNQCSTIGASSTCREQLADKEALPRAISLVSSGVDRALRGVGYSRYKVISAGCVTFQCRGSPVYRVGYGGAQWAVPIAVRIHRAQQHIELLHLRRNCMTPAGSGLSVSAHETKDILRAESLLPGAHSQTHGCLQVQKQQQQDTTQVRDPSVLLYVDPSAMETFLKTQSNKTRVEWTAVEHLPGTKELKEHAADGPVLLITESVKDCVLVAPAWKGKTQVELMIDKHTRAALLRLLVKKPVDDPLRNDVTVPSLR